MDEREISPGAAESARARYREICSTAPAIMAEGRVESTQSPSRVSNVASRLGRFMPGALGIAAWIGLAMILFGIVAFVISEYETAPGGIFGAILGGAVAAACFYLVLGALIGDPMLEAAGWKKSTEIAPLLSRLLQRRPHLLVADWEGIETRLDLGYAEYLQSPEWRQRRMFMLDRFNHRCQVCNANSLLQVHHRTYERLGHERIEDLTVLCRKCHRMFHEHRGMPTKYSPI